MNPMAFLLVGIGSALGGMARFVISVLAIRAFGPEFPWGTLAINITGSFIIGFFGILSVEDGLLPSGENAKVFVTVGLCGGFTTFSSFSLQTLSFVESGQSGRAALYAGLAVVAEPATALNCLAGAVAAAAVDAAAEIEVMHVRVDPDAIVSSTEEVAFQRIAEHYNGTAEARAAETRAVYDAWLPTLPEPLRPRVRWQERVGAEASNLVDEAKSADLLVLSRPRQLDGSDATHAALFKSGRPLLVVPDDWDAAAGLTRRIAIAWQPADHCRRAVDGALPWLRHADAVSVIIIAERGEDTAAGEIEHLLDHAGVENVDTIGVDASGNAGAQLLVVAGDLGAAALVMGAYRHGEMVEWMLGNTTRHVLASAHIPLFLAH